jgi:hypothetical protein
VVSGLLESEINRLLADARENLDFLDRRLHYWLMVGQRLQAAPRAFLPSYRVLNGLLGEIHVLGRRTASKVLVFYEYHALCENLRQSLFVHIADLKETKGALTEADVSVLRARLERACSAYRTLDGEYPELVTLRTLRERYEVPTAANVLQALDAHAAG